MLNINWSAQAKADYDENLDYLDREWSLEQVLTFTDKVTECLELISQAPELFPETEIKGIRKAVIVNQVTLFYQVSGTNIYLIRFWNNFKDPNNLKL